MYTDGIHTVVLNIGLDVAKEKTDFITAIEFFEYLVNPLDSFKEADAEKNYFIFTQI